MTYNERKEQARAEAIEYQVWQSYNFQTWEEVAYWCDYFTKLGKRYGLVKEFKENGII